MRDAVTLGANLESALWLVPSEAKSQGINSHGMVGIDIIGQTDPCLSRGSISCEIFSKVYKKF